MQSQQYKFRRNSLVGRARLQRTVSHCLHPLDVVLAVSVNWHPKHSSVFDFRAQIKSSPQTIFLCFELATFYFIFWLGAALESSRFELFILPNSPSNVKITKIVNSCGFLLSIYNTPERKGERASQTMTAVHCDEHEHHPWPITIRLHAVRPAWSVWSWQAKSVLLARRQREMMRNNDFPYFNLAADNPLTARVIHFY